MKYYCNPINVNYRYQFNQDPRNGGKIQIDREAADPSMICFKGTYYMFASMNLSVWVSEDLVHWESHRLPENLPLYDYAPDVRVMGDYVYFCASKRGEICNHYRTKDIINGPYEEIPGTFDFWDPNMFVDDDGRVYFYWGCSNATPVWGVELDPVTMKPLGERIPLIDGTPFEKGYERVGVDNSMFPASEEEIEAKYQAFLASQPNVPESSIPAELIPLIKGMFSNKPFIEGAWMDKYQGKYYLQYACPGAEYNVYADGVYVSDSPLGPFTPAANNPYSYNPGGFMPGAGHGSTMWDKQNNLWHTSTMRISVNHQFERRVGLWKAGFDADGELFCNQRYGDWPIAVEETEGADPWKQPQWYLLSYRKPVEASSEMPGKEAAFAVNEDATNWWQSATAGESTLTLNLEKKCQVHAVQINFADDHIDIPVPGKIAGSQTQARYIDTVDYVTRWKLEGSADGVHYEVIEDKSDAKTDLPHDLVVREEGVQVQYLKLTVYEVPYAQKPCISGFRVFGTAEGEKPQAPQFTAIRSEDRLDMIVSAETEHAVGYNILWGHRADKLYHSWIVYGEKVTEHRIGALVKGQDYFVRVDAFNESGITEGEVRAL